MKKLSKLLASSLVAVLAMTTLVPSASALGLKTDIIWFNENIFPGNLIVEEVGIDGSNTYFYADVCASEAQDFDDDEVKFSVSVSYDAGASHGGQSTNIYAYGPDDGDCKRVWINIENEGFDLVKNRTYTLTITADPSNELEESDETDNSASADFLIPYDIEINENPELGELLTPDVNFGIEETGVENGKFYADVYMEGDADSVSLNFNANQTNNTLTIFPTEGETTRYYSWGLHTFDVEEGDTVLLTTKVDYRHEFDETTEADNMVSQYVTVDSTPTVNFGIEETGVEDGKFYADIYASGEVSSVSLNFNANGTNNTLSIPVSDGMSKRYYSWGLHTFDVEEGDTVLLTTKIDYKHEFDETTEADNMVSQFVSVPSETDTTDFEITELGVDTDFSNAVATVRNDSDEDLYTTVNFSLSNGGEFNSTGSNHDLSTTIGAGDSFTFTSWGISSWTLEEGENYTLTVTVKQDGTTYDKEYYTFTYPTSDPEPTNEDDFLMQPSLVYLEIGDNDGVTDEVRTYYGSLNSNDTDLVQVDVIGSVKFEDHSNYSDDAYVDTSAGVWFRNTIIDEYDGLVLYVYPTSNDTTTYRSLQFNINGEFDATIDAENDLLETNLIGEGTDYASLTLLQYLDPEEEDAIQVLDSDNAVMELLQDLDLSNDELIVTEVEVNDNIELSAEDKQDFEPTEAAPYVPYEDVEQDSWYSNYVAELTDLGIVSGYNTGVYGPANEVTVAEMLKISLEAAGYGPTSNGKVGRHWASDYVNTAKDLGMTIVQESVDLDRTATREEVATMVTEAFEMDVPDYSASSFTDGEADTVEHLKQLGVVEGYNNGSFGFDKKINRAEVSKLVVNTLQVTR